MPKLYNTGTEIIEFTFGGNIYTLLPKHGTFKRVKEPYNVPIFDYKKNKELTLKRTREVWNKLSDEGRNSNWVEVPKEGVPTAIKAADELGLREFLRPEDEVLKAADDRLRELEDIVKTKEQELRDKEKDHAMKLAMLQRVEQEQVNKVARK